MKNKVGLIFKAPIGGRSSDSEPAVSSTGWRLAEHKDKKPQRQSGTHKLGLGRRV